MHDHHAGPELDRLIAEKVMGWKRGEHVSEDWRWSKWSEHWETCLASCGCGVNYTDAWAPSTNIAHAWEVVRKLEDHDHVFIVIKGTDSAFAGVLHYRTPVEYDLLIEATTAPLAICRAALKAMGI